MNDTIKREIKKANALDREIKNKQAKLTQIENGIAFIRRECLHKWGKTESDHTHAGSYTIKGDPPGTFGVDRRLDQHVPASTKYKWTRVCELCGQREVTKNSIGGHNTVSDFGDK